MIASIYRSVPFSASFQLQVADTMK
jgi:hypothetical protein